MDEVDKNEQAERKHGFTTPETLAHAKQNFAAMGMRAGSSNAPEPAEGRKYREWSAVVIRRFGYMKFCEIIACIMNGKKCNFELFKKALQLYQN